MSIDILKNLKVLLVEDEDKLAKLLKDGIGDYFYSFSIANNGKDGIIKFLQNSPDLVITDIMMPDLTGLEMSKELKQINPDIPIIILSAFSETDKLLNAIDIGVIKYFIKPFDPDELLDYIISIGQKLENKVIKLDEGFEFNKTTKNLYKDGKYIALSKREVNFIHLLLQNAKEMTDEKIIKSKLWDSEDVSDERLRTFIKRIRLKVSKTLIKNLKGRGYQIMLAQ